MFDTEYQTTREGKKVHRYRSPVGEPISRDESLVRVERANRFPVAELMSAVDVAKLARLANELEG